MALWECFALAGGDTDGDEQPHVSDRDLIRLAVDAVRGLREDYDRA